MSEIINKRASESLGKEVTIFLNNNFRFKGKLTNVDENYLIAIIYGEGFNAKEYKRETAYILVTQGD